jgi:hypothetical protein
LKEVSAYFEEATAKTYIATICMAYLLNLDQDISVDEIAVTFPFARYCAQHWIYHAGVRREGDRKVHGLIMEFFQKMSAHTEIGINCMMQAYLGMISAM